MLRCLQRLNLLRTLNCSWMPARGPVHSTGLTGRIGTEVSQWYDVPSHQLSLPGSPRLKKPNML